MKTWGWINRAAAAIAVVVIVLGVGSSALAQVDSGVRLGIDDGGHVIVTDVLPFSPASIGFAMATPTGGQTVKLRPGMLVTNLNGRTLIRLPQVVYDNPYPTPDPVTGVPPDPRAIGVTPSLPEAAVDPSQLPELIAQPVRSISALSPTDLANWNPTTSTSLDADFSPWQLSTNVAFTLGGGVIMLFLVAWWTTSGRAGEALRPLAMPTALALAGPIILAPLELSQSLVGFAGYGLLMPLSLAPLAAALVHRVDAPIERLLAAAGAIACGTAAVAMGLTRLGGPIGNYAEQIVPISVLATAMTAIPGLAAAGTRPTGRRDRSEPTIDGTVASRRVVSSAAYAVAGVSPFFAIQSAIGPYGMVGPYPILMFWLIVLWVASRLMVRPLTRLANRAQLQRDLVVAATEAERARVAADIHDDALQELTLLVRRLDATGDTEGADLARGVSERLRAICGDLRLPILDDLGIGPALDWLVLRIERIAGGEVRLEQADGSRPPADVELAFFRVAQEALANAVKHGRPPIVVRYRSADGFASLSIDDAGGGIAPGARETAEADGHHFGLLNMAQRAEAIGAILDVRRWPAGGTHVGLEWRAR